jgi:hypothetical protein
VKRRGKGGGEGSGRGHAEKEEGGGGRRGREVGRRCGPARHRRGGSGVLRQRWVAYASWARREQAANKGGDGRERLTRGRQRGPVVSGGVREGESKSEAAEASAPIGGPRGHNAGWRNSTRFESKRNSTGFKLISN